MLQREIFLAGEANAWLERNRNKIGRRDSVWDVIKDLKVQTVLEIGCSDGWRLRKMVDNSYCESAVGVDPVVGGYLGEIGKILIFRGTAETLPLNNTWKFDLVIFGFCLYLADPCDYFRIAAEADRVLADGGHLVIHDFAPPDRPYKVPYEHKEDVFSHHMDFAELWMSHPAYRWVASGDGHAVTMLKKDMKSAFAARPAVVVQN